MESTSKSQRRSNKHIFNKLQKMLAKRRYY